MLPCLKVVKFSNLAKMQLSQSLIFTKLENFTTFKHAVVL